MTVLKHMIGTELFDFIQALGNWIGLFAHFERLVLLCCFWTKNKVNFTFQSGRYVQVITSLYPTIQALTEMIRLDTIKLLTVLRTIPI